MSEAWSKFTSRGHVEEDEEEVPEKGWFKVIPRGLLGFAAYDLISMLVLRLTQGELCEGPLRAWWVVGILLGFPVDALIKVAAMQKTKYKQYRLSATELRDCEDTRMMEIEGLQLYSTGREPYDRESKWCKEYSDGGAMWHVIFTTPKLVTAYRVITSAESEAKFDPTSWVLEASNDGIEWDPIDEVEDAAEQVPMERDMMSRLFDELLHVEADSSFRKAFLLEVAACAVSLGWLVAGTSFVSLASESCVDSSPRLWSFSFVVLALTWSLLGTITVGLIVSAFLMIVWKLGKPAQPSSA